MAGKRIPVKPTPEVDGAPPDEQVLGMEAREFAAMKLAEVRKSRRNAEEHRSWVAAARMHGLEVEMYDRAHKHDADAHDPEEDLSPEELLENILLPAVAQWPRPYLERLYLECLTRLGIEPPPAAEG
jgi:hypothetical protein